MARMTLGELMQQQAQEPGIPVGEGSRGPMFPPLPAQPQQQAPQQGWGDYLSGVGGALAHGAVQGATFGATDLAGDWISPETQKKIDENSKQHPWANTVGNVGGAVGQLFVPGLRELNGVRAATALARVGMGAVGGAVGGGITSGIESVRQGKSANQVGQDALGGAAMGGAFGGAGGAIGETVAPWIGQKIAGFTKAAGAEDNGATRWASDRLNKSMQSTGNTPDSIVGETAHIPNAWAADHPGMVHAMQDVNRAGGDAHADFAQAARERISPQARDVRAAEEIANPTMTYGDRLNGELQQWQQKSAQAADALPPVQTQGLRQELGNIIDDGSALIANPHTNRLGELETNLWANDQVPGRMLHNTKDVLDQRINGNSSGIDIQARQAVDNALDRTNPQFPFAGNPYDEANRAATLRHEMKNAYEMGRAGKDRSGVNAVIDSAQGKLPNHPSINTAMTEAFQGGMADTRNFYNGPMSREKVMERTAAIAQRNPAAVQDAVELGVGSLAGNVIGQGGVTGALTGVGTKLGINALETLIKPGQEHAKALAGFLRLSGPEREAILREAAARGEKVGARSKLISDALKYGARGTATAVGDRFEDQLTGK